MGVYSIGRNYSRDFDNTGIVECQYEPGMEAALNIVAESELNFNKLMQAVAKDELGYLQENGVEMVYESGTASGFIEKLKAFFLKIWEKIKGLFRKFFAKINSYLIDDKKFADKYKDRVINANLKDFKFKGFKFTNLDGNSVTAKDTFNAALGKLDDGNTFATYNKNYGSIVDSVKMNNGSKKEEIKRAVEKFNDDEQDLLEEARGATINCGSCTSTEFTEELFKYFRDDETSKEEKELSDLGTNPSDLLSIISTTKKTIDLTKKDLSDFERSIKDTTKALDKASRDLTNAIPDKNKEKDAQEAMSIAVQVVNIWAKIRKDALAIAQVVNGAKLTAIKDRNRQAKAICVALVGRKSIKESYDDYSYNEGASFLSELNFI